MPRITQLAAGALAALALGAPAAAQADSIVYVKDGNVWLAEGDGSRQYQVTSTGTYAYASQSDDGTIVALNGDRRIHRLNRVSGAVTADFATPVSDTPPNSSFVFRGPFGPDISPDGTKIAYGWAAQYTVYDPYCGYPGGCKEGKLIVGTGYSHADRTTAWDEPGFRQHSGWQYPSWFDNQHVVISKPAEIGNLDAWVDTVGDDAYGEKWFGVSGDGDVTVNRQQTAIASIASTGKFLDVMRMTGPWPGGGINDCLFIGDREGPDLQSPSWSPDGERLAYSDSFSVLVLSNIDWTGCNWDAPGTITRVDAGAYPDWGPADVPPARAAPRVDPPRVDPPRVDPRPDPRRADPRGPRGNALGAKVTAASLGRGVTVTFRAPGAGRLSAKALAGRRVVGAGSRKVTRGGAAKVTLRFTRAGRRALRRGGSVTMKLTFAPRRGAAKKVTLTTKVRGR